MITGDPPFVAKTAQAAIAKMMTSPPPSARALRADVPRGIDAVVRKGLAISRFDRYTSARSLTAALDAGVVPTVRNLLPRLVIVAALIGVFLVVVEVIRLAR